MDDDAPARREQTATGSPGCGEVSPLVSAKSEKLRTLFVGLPSFEGSFFQDLLRELMRADGSLRVVAVTTPAPQVFARTGQFPDIEFIQKLDFEFSESIDRLGERHHFRLSKDLLAKHAKSEYTYLSISDRRSVIGLPVFKRRALFRQLLAYWYDFLSSRKIDAIVVIGYPHAGWNNVLIDVAQELSIKTVVLDFTVISDTTLVADVERLRERVPAQVYAHLTTEQLRGAIPRALLDRLAAPLFGLDFSHKVKREVQDDPAVVSYSSLVKSLLRNPRRRLRPSFTRLSGDVTQLWMAAYAFRAKRHVADLAGYYDSISSSQLDLDRPFVYFPLHMQPERSTTPAGGFFEDQLLVAEILAASLPSGWTLYIKEHPSQFWQARAAKQAWFRDRGYYARLKALPNTQLVSLGYDSQKLIRKAAAVATVTGTAGWEALLSGKTCLAFGEPWYLGCRACYGPGSVEECRAALEAASIMTPAHVERAVLEFLLHYSDRILPVGYLPDRTRLTPQGYTTATSDIAAAIERSVGSKQSTPTAAGNKAL